MPLRGPEGQEFEDFDSCVNAISGDGTSQEEAQQICGSFTEVDKGNAKLKKRVIEYYDDFEDVSKDSVEEETFQVQSDEIVKRNDEKQIAYSIVLKADRPDLEKDTFPSEVIEKAAHEFMVKSQDINLEHEFDTDKVQIVESFISPSDFNFNGTDVQKGDWVMATKFLDDKLWQLAKEGKLSGFSIEGTARKIPASEVQ